MPRSLVSVSSVSLTTPAAIQADHPLLTQPPAALSLPPRLWLRLLRLIARALPDGAQQWGQAGQGSRGSSHESQSISSSTTGRAVAGVDGAAPDHSWRWLLSGNTINSAARSPRSKPLPAHPAARADARGTLVRGQENSPSSCRSATADRLLRPGRRQATTVNWLTHLPRQLGTRASLILPPQRREASARGRTGR
jgi:hypothetical protein